jgi:hypothetical protein
MMIIIITERTYKFAAIGSSGVVDEDVDSTEVSFDPLEGGLNISLVGNVTFQSVQFTRCGFEGGS